MTDQTALAARQAENARLISLLETHGIEWRRPKLIAVVVQEPELSRLSKAEKVALFQPMFRERTDVYPARWGERPRARQAALCCFPVFS